MVDAGQSVHGRGWNDALQQPSGSSYMQSRIAGSHVALRLAADFTPGDEPLPVDFLQLVNGTAYSKQGQPLRLFASAAGGQPVGLVERRHGGRNLDRRVCFKVK